MMVFYSLMLILKLALMIYVKKKHHYEYGIHKKSFFIMFFAIFLNVAGAFIYKFISKEFGYHFFNVGLVFLMNAIILAKPNNDFLSGLSKLDYL